MPLAAAFMESGTVFNVALSLATAFMESGTVFNVALPLANVFMESGTVFNVAFPLGTLFMVRGRVLETVFRLKVFIARGTGLPPVLTVAELEVTSVVLTAPLGTSSASASLIWILAMNWSLVMPRVLAFLMARPMVVSISS